LARFEGLHYLTLVQFRDWFWELEASGLGPDHFFVAQFVPNPSNHLLPVVQQFMPTGFVSETRILSNDSQIGSQRFIDQHTFDALKMMQETGIRNNIYISSSVEVHDETLGLENTYSCHEDGETAFLIAVFQSENLTVQGWRVFAGGSGFDSIEVARGQNAVSFLEYVKLENQ
jgi:hypothetical protein